jgi:DnaJ homolog subfamily C member 13
MPGHRIDPPCGRAHIQMPNRGVTDNETATMHLKHLGAAAKDTVVEGGSVPGSRARLWRRIREFNACISYSGVPPTIEVPEAVLMAIITMLPANAANLPPEAPPLPPPSPKAAATIIGFISCLRRLLASRNAASHVMSFPAAVTRIMSLLRNGSEGVAAEVAGLVAMLIGGGPGENPMLTDSKGEWHATFMHTKSMLFSELSYATILVNRLRPSSVSPVLSMAVVDVLEAMLCEPYGETTQHTTFVELLRQVAGLRRRLFALFGHPAESVRETVAVIMRTIAEEDAIAAESMRDAALRDGALLRHLLHAFFLPAGERRNVSRQLIALWADSYQPALNLLSRILPPGLVAYLHTRSDATEDPESRYDEAPLSRRQRRILQQKKRVQVSRSVTAAGAKEHVFSPQGNNNNNYISVDNITNAEQAAIPGDYMGPPVQEPNFAHAGQYGFYPNAYPGMIPNAGPQYPEQYGIYSTDNTTQLVDSEMDNNSNLAGSFSSDAPVPAQVVVENTPVGSGRLLCNWHEFWKAFGLDHNRADLIWNERTRQELREALQAEVHNLDVEKERTEDIVTGSTDNEDSNNTPRISWNYSEFYVNYHSLSKEVCVGQYYLRLFLESGSSYLRDPFAFFRALYHRFLCEADVGLTVDGAIPDELGSSDDWCDMGRLDGFGGGGGSQVRELCARAMAIVYEQHHENIGPFEGTAHITVLLDRTNDRALRHRLLLLLKVRYEVYIYLFSVY